jgi:hypothetical protein
LRAAWSNKHQPLRLLAGIFGALPVPWGKIQNSKALVNSWLALPSEIRKWREEYTRSL